MLDELLPLLDILRATSIGIQVCLVGVLIVMIWIAHLLDRLIDVIKEKK